MHNVSGVWTLNSGAAATDVFALCLQIVAVRRLHLFKSVSEHAKSVMAAIQRESFLQPDLGSFSSLTSGPPSSAASTHPHPSLFLLVSCFIHPLQQRDYLNPEVCSVFCRQPHPSPSQIKGFSLKANPVLFPSQWCSTITFDNLSKLLG